MPLSLVRKGITRAGLILICLTNLPMESYSVTASNISPPSDMLELSNKLRNLRLEVVDQNGNKKQLYDDILKDKIVAINFIFTNCKMICPPMAAIFSKIQDKILDQPDLHLLSVSIDPEQDTPEKLKGFAAKFGHKSNWTLITQRKADLNLLSKELLGKIFEKESHNPVTIIYNDHSQTVKKIYGLVSADTISQSMFNSQKDHKKNQQSDPITSPNKKEDSDHAARNYFTDTVLLDQNGKQHKFYSDILRNHIVLINFAFTSCTSSCTIATRNLAKLQGRLGDKLGKDILIVTISVDPTNDTPKVLKEYAEKNGAKPGWLFLTGDKPDVYQVLNKIGGAVSIPSEHTSVILIGDLRTGNWSKAPVGTSGDDLAMIVEKFNEKN